MNSKRNEFLEDTLINDPNYISTVKEFKEQQEKISRLIVKINSSPVNTKWADLCIKVTELYLTLGSNNEAQNYTEKVINYYERLQKKFGTLENIKDKRIYAQANYFHAVYVEREQDTEKSRKYLTRAINIFPQSPYYNDRGALFLNARKYDLAKKDFTEAIKILEGKIANKSLAAVLKRLCRRKENDHDKKLLAIYYKNRALARYLDKDVDGFEQDLIKSNQYVKNRQIYHRDRGSVLLQLGEHAAAINELNKAISMKKDDWEAYISRARCNHEMGNTSKALDDLNYVIDQDPTNKTALFTKEGICFSIGDYAAALKCNERIIKIKPVKPFYYAKAAECAYAMGDKKRALEYLDRAIKNFTTLGKNVQKLTKFREVILLSMKKHTEYERSAKCASKVNPRQKN